MQTLLIAAVSGLAFLIAYHTYGKWLGRRIFNLSADAICPSHRLRDNTDYVPTPKSVVFGHHFTSIAGTGPIVGPAIAVMWGWLPALLWVIFGSIFIGAVHDLGSLVVSLRNNGQTVGDIAGRLLNRRVRILFLLVLFMALTIVLAIFGLVIAAVFKQYPSAIFPCLIQIPIAIAIGTWLHRKGVGLLLPSLLALGAMYLTVYFGDWGPLHAFNTWMANLSTMTWVILLLLYSYVASVIPVWLLLQPRDYINSLQLVSAMALIVAGLFAAALWGGAPPVEGADRVPLEIAAPMVEWSPAGAPWIFPFLFITVACGAVSGFHCLVSSGTSSKQLKTETDARFVGYGAMLAEGFLAVIVILACAAGLGLGSNATSGIPFGTVIDSGGPRYQQIGDGTVWPENTGWVDTDTWQVTYIGQVAWRTRYTSWSAADGLAGTVSAFVDGAANFLNAIGLPPLFATALLGVLVASFAGTTLDTACRLQRYVVQELAATFASRVDPSACPACGYDLSFNVSGACPECGAPIDGAAARHPLNGNVAWRDPRSILTNKHGATIFAVVIAVVIAALPAAGASWSWVNAGKGGMILWPLFGATNQLLAGLAFLVLAFYLWRRNKPIWFLILPLIFMLIMPAWAMLWSMFIEAPGKETSWLDDGNWLLLGIGGATIVLEVWMIVEAALLWPRVKGAMEIPVAAAPTTS